MYDIIATGSGREVPRIGYPKSDYFLGRFCIDVHYIEGSPEGQ